MGERLICIQEVGSSNLPRSTNDRKIPSGDHLISPNYHSQPDTSIDHLITGFLLDCTIRGLSPRTISFYGDNLRRFLWWLKQKQLPESINAITPQIIKIFVGYIQTENHRWQSTNPMSNRKASITTSVRYLTCIKVFCQWCIAEGYTPVNPASLIKIKEPKRLMKAVPTEDIQKLLGQFNHRDFKSVRNKAIILVLLDTGLRVSECANLKLNDINNDKGILKVTGKGNKERLVRIGYTTQKALWRYISQRQSNSDSLWTDASGNAISANTIKLIMKRMSNKLGIKCNPHALRRSFAIYYLRNGDNIFELQLLLGHSSLEMVKRYLGSLQFEDAFKGHIKASPVDCLKL